MIRPSKRDVILGLLRQHGEMYGLDLVRRSDGVLGRGVVYVDLARLQEAGEIESRLGPDGKRRIYRIAPGRVLLETWLRRLVSCSGGTKMPTCSTWDVVHVVHCERVTVARVVSRQVMLDDALVDWTPLEEPRHVNLTAVEMAAVEREAREREMEVVHA